MEGFQVATLEAVVGETDIFVSCTGDSKIITLEHMKKTKNNAIVGKASATVKSSRHFWIELCWRQPS